MKKLFFILALYSISAQSVELVCKGNSAQNSSQRVVYVDCADRRAVIDALGAAWTVLRRQSIGGSAEDMCWNPYNRAKEMHPSISFDGIAQTFLMQCNMSLQYVK